MALTRREELKVLVKVKIDEISPFDNVNGDETVKDFIAAADDDNYDQVNPISSYIEKTLDKASEFCLNDLPVSLLSGDVDFDTNVVRVDKKGVGHIDIDEKYARFIRISVCGDLWGKDVVSFITPDSQLYVLQQNRWTRGGRIKPVVAIVYERQELELYSFAPSVSSARANVYYIESGKAAEKVKSAIDDYIALRCAAYVMEILGDADKANVLMAEYDNKKKLIQ